MDFSSIYEMYDFNGMEDKFQSLFPQWELSFRELVLEIMEGNGAEVFLKQGQALLQTAAAQMDAVKYVCVTLLLIGILSTVFMNFASIFPNQQIGTFGFQLTYLIMIIFLIRVNTEVFAVAKTGLDQGIEFMQAFLPCYFLVVGASGGSATAFGFYQVFLIGIYLVEQVVKSVILPLIRCYTLLCVMNGIWEEDRLSMFIRLLKQGIQGFLKILLTLAVGSGVFQSIITPVIDTVKMTAMKKTVEVIPGVGELADGTVQVLLGMSVLLKNTLGIICILLLLLLCAVPLLKVFLFMAVIKGSAAIMGVSADKRLTVCANQFSDGIMLLLQAMLTSVMFFLILVLIVTFTTNRGFV